MILFLWKLKNILWIPYYIPKLTIGDIFYWKGRINIRAFRDMVIKYNEDLLIKGIGEVVAERIGVIKGIEKNWRYSN